MTRLLVIVPIVFAAAPAFAQPGSDDPAPAPQTEPWSNVSHINGQVVPVGQHGDYLISYKRFNVSTNPIGWIAGFYGVSASYAVTQNIVLRGDVNYFKGGLFGDDTSGYEVGVSAPIYLRRAYSGPFIEPGLIARGITHSEDSFDLNGNSTGTMSTTDTMVGPEMLAGYHWTFDSGLNVAMAFGIAKNLNASDSSDSIQPAGYFRVGYAF
jgi:hypothetical protein